MNAIYAIFLVYLMLRFVGIPFMDVALRIARPKTYSEGPTGVTNSMMALPAGLIPGVL